jgi:site-specific DNA recombinase
MTPTRRPAPAVELPIDVYARVSLDADKKLISTGDQVLECQDRILELGYQVGEVHVDNSKSAWNQRILRPGWEAMMTRLESGVAGGLIVFDLARFARRPIDGERLIRIAERGIIVLDSESQYDLTSANGKKTFREHLNAAAYESDRLSTRVRRGKKHKVERGESNHSNRPFGFETDGITAREPEATQVAEAITWMLDGGTLLGLTRHFNERGIRTTFDNDWSMMSMRQMLQRPRNAGLAVHHGEIKGKLTGGGEPIVTESDWEQVCALFASRRRGRPLGDIYLASGLLVCSKCRGRLYGKQVAGVTYPDGVKQRRYVCCPTIGGCNGTSIDWRGTDAAVETIVLAALNDRKLVAAQKQAADAAAGTRAKLANRIAVIDEARLQIAGRFGRGEMELTEYDAITGPQKQQLLELRAQLKALPTVAGLVDEGMGRAELLEAWAHGDLPSKRKLARNALGTKMIVVHPTPAGAPRVFNADRLQVEAWTAPVSKLGSRRR